MMQVQITERRFAQGNKNLNFFFLNHSKSRVTLLFIQNYENGLTLSIYGK
jgi:hypothetical protein